MSCRGRDESNTAEAETGSADGHSVAASLLAAGELGTIASLAAAGVRFERGGAAPVRLKRGIATSTHNNPFF